MLFFLAKGAFLSPFLVKEACFLEFFGKKKHLLSIFWCIGLLPPSLETESVGRWMGILEKSLRIHNQGLKKHLSICGDF